jgi:hypothetical protein
MFVLTGSIRQFQDLEGGEHLALEVLVMDIEDMDVFRRSTWCRAAETPAKTGLSTFSLRMSMPAKVRMPGWLTR